MDDLTILIGGEEIPSPISIKYDIEDIDGKSLRDIKRAILDRNVIRQGALKILLSYSCNSPDDIMKILRLTKPKEFRVTALDPNTFENAEFVMYSAKKSFQPIALNGIWCKGLALTLTEV